MFGYTLHSHLIGVAIQVDWYRYGRAMGVLAKDDSYDFNYQENRLFVEPKKLLPVSVLSLLIVEN